MHIPRKKKKSEAYYMKISKELKQQIREIREMDSTVNLTAMFEMGVRSVHEQLKAEQEHKRQ